MTQKTVMGEEEIRRALLRVAHEIVERNKGAEDLVFIGIDQGGVPLSHRLSLTIQGLEKREVPWGRLDIGPYRDDLSYLDTLPPLHPSDIPTDISAKKVILVDDVLYTGRSIRAAMDAIVDFGRPSTVQLAVLVDRGHRELPIHPDYVGKNLPTAKSEKVEVRLKEIEGWDEVVIV
jgi:pyrimidine operon attenuation protein/uracil phosphoribosyltransferase